MELLELPLSLLSGRPPLSDISVLFSSIEATAVASSVSFYGVCSTTNSVSLRALPSSPALILLVSSSVYPISTSGVLSYSILFDGKVAEYFLKNSYIS